MKKLIININKLFPAAAKRFEILRDLRLNWASVVGPALVRHSLPYSLGVNKISVYADGSQAANMILRMKGNIVRALTSRYTYEADENFELKVVRETPRRFHRAESRRSRAENKVDEEKVRQYMQDAPETLPDDINYAISHLQVFLEKRLNNFTPQSRT